MRGPATCRNLRAFLSWSLTNLDRELQPVTVSSGPGGRCAVIRRQTRADSWVLCRTASQRVCARATSASLSCSGFGTKIVLAPERKTERDG